ncbi:MAG: hypothetical protein IPO05_02575 [Flavobacteriales bacterium]|nr:hypothetical protein [Flavobacteriales bacterium]
MDKFAFNQIEASLSGPLLFKKDSVGNKVKPLIGFFLSGQYTNVVDGCPLYIGDLRVRPRYGRTSCRTRPALPRTTTALRTGLRQRFPAPSDLETIKTRQNAGQTAYTASGKIDITTTPTINFTVGGSLDYSNRQDYNRNNALLNAENNIRIKATTWRAFVKFTQRFTNRSEEDEKKATIKNAFYTLQLDYSQFAQNVEDQVHGDRFFDYGYVGKFNTFRAPQFEFSGPACAVAQIGERIRW